MRTGKRNCYRQPVGSDFDQESARDEISQNQLSSNFFSLRC